MVDPAGKTKKGLERLFIKTTKFDNKNKMIPEKHDVCSYLGKRV